MNPEWRTGYSSDVIIAEGGIISRTCPEKVTQEHPGITVAVTATVTAAVTTTVTTTVTAAVTAVTAAATTCAQPGTILTVLCVSICVTLQPSHYKDEESMAQFK